MRRRRPGVKFDPLGCGDNTTKSACEEVDHSGRLGQAHWCRSGTDGAGPVAKHDGGAPRVPADPQAPILISDIWQNQGPGSDLLHEAKYDSAWARTATGALTPSIRRRSGTPIGVVAPRY